MARSDTDDRSITATRAGEGDRPVIANLLQLMLYDLSPYYGEWIGRDGRYDYAWLDLYWTEQDRYPYLICRDRQLSGFALVMAHSPITGRAPCWFMAEFFILKAQRRKGTGLSALRRILTTHRGDWEIAAIEKNRDAVSFWSQVLPQLQLNDLRQQRRVHDKFDWVLHTFAS